MTFLDSSSMLSNSTPKPRLDPFRKIVNVGELKLGKSIFMQLPVYNSFVRSLYFPKQEGGPITETVVNSSVRTPRAGTDEWNMYLPVELLPNLIRNMTLSAAKC